MKSGQWGLRTILIVFSNILLIRCMVDPCPDVVKIRNPPGLPAHMYKDGLISDCQFVDNDSKLNFQKAGTPIHSWYTNCPSPVDEESNPLHYNTVLLDIGDHGALEEFEVGMPHYGIHTYSVFVDRRSMPVCRVSYFALAMSKAFNQYGQTDVFIVHADSYLSVGSCDHKMHLDKGRRSRSWRPLALLAGFRQCCLSSLGTVVAISPRGTRVAAANWSRVLFWSVDPEMLDQGDLQHYFPACDYNTKKCIGRLRPTLLPSEGVVHKLLWTNETQLYASTDQGLAKWDIGHLSEGRRENLSLAYDVLPESVAASRVSIGRGAH